MNNSEQTQILSTPSAICVICNKVDVLNIQLNMSVFSDLCRVLTQQE